MKFKQLNRLTTCGVLIAALSIAAFSQQPTPATPSVERLRQVITYLASDALEGRRTGAPGANDAAHYIAGEFSLMGLRPGMQMAGPGRTRGEIRARYLQPFPFVTKVELGKNNLLMFDPQRRDLPLEIKVGTDWIPFGFSSNGGFQGGETVFAGYGISAPELKYDDYAVSQARDRVAIAFAGTPDGDNPHGQFVQAGQIRFKAAAARAAGVKALLIITNEEILQHDRLAQLSYDNAGEAGIPVAVVSRATAAWILGDLTALEKIADARIRSGSSPRIGHGLNLIITLQRHKSPSLNVIGILPGSDPGLRDEAIVIGAHYDHLGFGGEGSGSLSATTGIHHGADDNASGVAGLLELARMFASQNPKPRRTIVFIAFSGEEEGLIGSSYYVNHPIVPLANTVAMINMDMIGRLKDQKLIVGGIGTAREWRDVVASENLESQPTTLAQLSNPDRTPGKVTIVMGTDGRAASAVVHVQRFNLSLNEDGYGPSDHSSFYAKQVPVLFFWTGTHDDYHKPSDTADKINYEGEARVVSFVANVIRDIDGRDKRLTYTVAKSESSGRAMGFRVYLGTIPNYADSNDGLRLDGVRDDSPAAKAGLKAGDKIVKMAGREVKNVYDYTYALGEMKAGQEYEVEIVRGSEKLTLKITPAARK